MVQWWPAGVYSRVQAVRLHVHYVVEYLQHTAGMEPGRYWCEKVKRAYTVSMYTTSSLLKSGADSGGMWGDPPSVAHPNLYYSHSPIETKSFPFLLNTEQ